MTQTVPVAALLLISALLSQPALAEERVIGLLALPEVFGRGACDRFTPQPVELRATPQGRVVGTLLVVKPWTHHGDNGCEGLEVGVRALRAATVQELPTKEYGYEEPGAIVLERRGKWFRVRLTVGSAWLEASAQDTFYSVEQLFTDSPTYLTEAWTGQVAASPGSAGRTAKSPRLARQPVRVRRAAREKDGLWFLVDIMSHSACDGDGEPTVADQGWVPAYGQADAPTIWFFSRGC